jgi:outer membrane immunogenic protein
MQSLKIAASLILLSSASALAADLPSIKSAPVAPPAPMWAGFYAGLNAGGTWASNNIINSSTQLLYTPQNSADLYTAAVLSGPRYLSNPLGFIGGGQIGYNWQIRANSLNIITGIEADIQGLGGVNSNANLWNYAPYAGNGNQANNPFSITHNIQANSNLSWLGTIRGRLGYELMPSLLLYGTGGLAYGGYSSNIQHMMNSVDISTCYNFLVYGANNNSQTMVGWTAGGGAEWMLMPNLSVKAEYLYFDLGNSAGSLINNAYGYANANGMHAMVSLTNYSQRISGNIARAGVNYHFNFSSAPVVAKF